jgi:hypothetical protein
VNKTTTEQADSLKSLTLQTDRNANTLVTLQTSVDDQLSIASATLASLSSVNDLQSVDILALQQANTTLEVTLATQATSLQTMQSQIIEWQSMMTTMTDFASTFQIGNLLTKDDDGNVDLLAGTLRTAKIVTEGLSIETTTATTPTLGTATLYPVATDIDGNGLDDYTGKSMTDPEVVARDGKNMSILTAAVSLQSRIFVTPIRF